MVIKFVLFILLLFKLPLLADAIEPDVEMDGFSSSVAGDVHGFFDLAFKNDYVTPRGLLVTNTGLTIQPLLGLALDVYNGSCGSKVSVSLGVWNDIWTKQGNPYVGSWNELDWFIGVTAVTGNWKLGVQYLQFLSPPHNFSPENNVEFFADYDDSSFNWPIAFHPYVKVFWAVSGDSTVVVGRKGNTYDVEIGLVPTLELQSFVLTAPTWITVGPASFWNGGTLGLKDKKSNFGVFSTGLHAKFPLAFIPARLGHWYFAIGGQYYGLINDSLLQAQTITLGVSTYKRAHRHIGVASAGLGIGF